MESFRKGRRAESQVFMMQTLLSPGISIMVAELRAFIIDDDPGIRSFLSMLLKRRGYEVHEFPRGVPCEVCRNKPGRTCTDVVICDVCMPGVRGTEFVRRQQFIGCQCKNVALMSGQWRQAELRQARQLGCQIFNKPFQLGEIDAWLDECELRIDPDRVLTDLVPGND